MLLSFLLNVFSISVCHCLKSLIYKKVFVCVCVCVWARVRVHVRVCCVMQDVSKTKNLISSERVQKPIESEIWTHIGNTLKI